MTTPLYLIEFSTKWFSRNIFEIDKKLWKCSSFWTLSTPMIMAKTSSLIWSGITLPTSWSKCFWKSKEMEFWKQILHQIALHLKYAYEAIWLFEGQDQWQVLAKIAIRITKMTNRFCILCQKLEFLVWNINQSHLN